MIINEDVWKPIHEALHDPAVTEVYVEGKKYPIELYGRDRLRFVDREGVRFIEQNKKKLHSPYADKARKGMKITWFTTKFFDKWYGHIEDNRLVL